MAKDNYKDIHVGHRERLKNRFLNEGLDDFEKHNILELLLFYAIPRVDTNEIAHDLIREFGSLSEVMNANFDDLVKVDRITPNAAVLLKLIPSLARAYLTDKSPAGEVFDSAEKAGQFFIKKFTGETSEVVYLLCLDSSLNYISCDKITKGTVSRANLSIRTIVENVVKHNASSVILAHNHPRGFPIPSAEDIKATKVIHDALDFLEIRLIDHIVVAQNDYTSIDEDSYPLGIESEF